MGQGGTNLPGKVALRICPNILTLTAAEIRTVIVSGTNGKTTTTALTGKIMSDYAKSVFIVGNIGIPYTSMASHTTEETVTVAEISSFQLETTHEFAPEVTAILNITPDHLDRYEYKFQNYIDAKMRITQNQTEEDTFIYWNDDENIQRELDKIGIRAQKKPFSLKKTNIGSAYVTEDKLCINTPSGPLMLPIEELAIKGTHNIYNSMAAAISAVSVNIENDKIRKSLSNFTGVEHRLEPVCKVKGVQYINDSKATNVNSCWYALQSMKTKTVLILGGKDKGNDYSEIAELVKAKCVGLIYMGLHNEKLHDFFDGFGLPVADVQSMEDAVNAAYQMAKKGETVLLSPCCASFDLFKNYEDRGEQFKQTVKQL